MVTPDGSFGMAGETSTVVFTWRWTGGPLASLQHRTTGNFSHAWSVYEGKVESNLSATIGGDE